MGNKIFLERKPLLFQPLEHRGESSASHFTIFSKRFKVQNKELFKTKMLWKNYFIQWISWIFLLPYKLARYRAHRQRVKWSSERKISSVPVFKQDLQKSGKCFTVIKNCIQIIMLRLEFLIKLVRKIAQESSKVTILTVPFLFQRVAYSCYVGLKVYRNIYWRIIKSYSSKHSANYPFHQVNRTTGTAVTVTRMCCVAWWG